jgi:hypothetical protein
MVFPFGIGVIVCVGSTGVSVGGIEVGANAAGVVVEDGFCPQLFNVRIVAMMNMKVAFLFFMGEPSMTIVQPNYPNPPSASWTNSSGNQE